MSNGYVPTRREKLAKGYVITEWTIRAQQWLKYTLSHEGDEQGFLDITAREARELSGEGRYEQS